MSEPRREGWNETEAELLRLLVENAEDCAVFVVDPQGRVQSWNSRAERLLGYQDDEIIGRDYQVFYTPENIQAGVPRRVIEQARVAGRIEDNHQLVRKDGSRFAASGTMTSLRGEGHTLRGFVKIVHDRSGMKRAEPVRSDQPMYARNGIEPRQPDTVLQIEDRFRSLMEQAPFSIQVFAPDGRTLRVNKAWEDLWGLRLDQIADYNVLEDSQLDTKGVLPHLRRAFAGEPSRIPGICYDPNETVPNRTSHQDPLRWVSATAYPIKDATGRVREVVLVHEDITERKKAEEALQRTEERLRLITDSLPTLISYVDSEGIYRLNNRAYEEWFRHSRHEVTGRHMRDVLGESAWAVIGKKVDAAFSGHTVQYEAQVEYKDAGKRWIDATYVPHLEDGRVVGLFVLVNDITDRKKAEEAVRKSEALFRSLADNAPAMLWITDPTGYCNYLSALWYEYTGRTPGTDIGYGWLEAIHPDDLEETKRIFSQANQDRSAFRIDYRLRRHDGEYCWAVDAGLPRFAGGTFQGFVGCVFDVHERKIAEEANSRLVAELQDADRRKDEFLATLAHELRNPLAPLRNGLQVLKLADPNDGMADEARAMMERQLAHMVHLIDDLLDLSRISRGKIELRKERIELATAVQQAVETSRPAIESAGHDLTIEAPPGPIYVDADVTRLAQVFSNLLNNAAKYSDRGGRIRLSMRRQDGEAVISVLDDGIGIPADMLPHIFEMFTQVDRNLNRSQGGLGIGLSIVKRLVEMHDGSVIALSTGSGMGSEFIVRLPLAPFVHQTQQNEGEAQGLLKPRRILVVDDNRDAALSLAMMLRLMGNETKTAHDGLEALEVAAVYQPDLVILDIGMPKMNGYDAARHMREQPWAERAVLVALTGWGQEEDRRKSLDSGFDLHLTKPIQPNVLMRLLSGTDPDVTDD